MYSCAKYEKIGWSVVGEGLDFQNEEEKKERLRTMIWPGHEGMDVKQCQAKRAGDERSKECGRSKWMKVE